MFEEFHVGYLFLPILLITTVYAKLIKRDTGDLVKDKLKDVQIMLVGYGAVLLVFIFWLPITPSLSTFGYPETVEDINTQKKVLMLFQRYNEAIVKTAEVVHWFLFVSAIWFIGLLHGLISALKASRDKELQAKHDEKAV